mmetsp:Transcript_74154/g.143518  ORF Transcript_74154/g.143518 Transcript_74154/m.143518 type:complete len:326 (+) Transcript_74154:55-1032(+)
MAPKPKNQPNYAALSKGTQLQVEYDGTYYLAEVVTVSKDPKRAKAPLKVHYTGWDKTSDEWVGADRVRSKALRETSAPTPTEPAKPIEFHYWNIRGLAAAPRMIAAYSKLKINETRYGWGDAGKWFGEIKPEFAKDNVLVTLPILKDGNRTVTMSNSVILYLARRARLSGPPAARDDIQALLCDVYDMRDVLVQLCYWYKGVCRTVKEFNEQKGKYFETKAKPFYDKYEGWLTKRESNFFIGSKATAPDFHIWEMLDQHEMLAKDVGADSPLTDKPKLKAFYDRFRALPQLKDYFESDAYKLPCNVPEYTFWSGAGSSPAADAPQ